MPRLCTRAKDGTFALNEPLRRWRATQRLRRRCQRFLIPMTNRTRYSYLPDVFGPATSLPCQDV